MAIPGLLDDRSGRSFALHGRGGFTLVEMMVAVGLTVLMMTMVVTVFGLVMDSIRGSRASIEITDRLRAARNRLQFDLEGVTAPMTPPLDPGKGLGYTEIFEGPMGPCYLMSAVARTDSTDQEEYYGNTGDTTVGDLDDMLMFTIRSDDEPFVGRMPLALLDGGGNVTGLDYRIVQSRVAEVAWFVRGTTLYRRVLLVYTPTANDIPANTRFPTVADIVGRNFYLNNDLSVHVEGDFTNPATLRIVPNTLGELTKRENRYAHQPFAWPYDARFWGNLGLPTLEECSGGALSFDTFSGTPPARVEPSLVDPNGRPLFVPKNYIDVFFIDATANPSRPVLDPNLNPRIALYPDPNYTYRTIVNSGDPRTFDAWRHPHPCIDQNHVTGQFRDGARIGEDVILTNVVGFDVKVWDPGAPIITIDNSTPITVMPDDPPIRYTDMGNEVEAPAINYALARLSSGTASIAGFGAYVDLNYMCQLGPIAGNNSIPNYDVTTFPGYSAQNRMPAPQFHHCGDIRSGLFGAFPKPVTPWPVNPTPPNKKGTPQFTNDELRSSVYDTYSTHYESDGINQSAVPWSAAPLAIIDAGVNGLDDNANGAVDETSAWPNLTGENETAPPYPHPLRGIQIKIRVFEPDTRLIREVTLEHKFVPQ